MPYKDPDVREQYRKDYYESNKKKYIDRANEYNRNNKEKRHRTQTKSRWKQYGVITDNFDDLYDYYMKTKNCELCSIELTTGKRSNTSKCLDHCHETGKFRNIVCHSCNCKMKLC